MSIPCSGADGPPRNRATHRSGGFRPSSAIPAPLFNPPQAAPQPGSLLTLPGTAMNLSDLLPEMLTASRSVLGMFTTNGEPAFGREEEVEVVHDFLDQPWARIVLVPEGKEALPRVGFNTVFIADAPDDALYARIYREGVLVSDDLLPASDQTRELREWLAPRWRRVRFLKAEKAMLLQHILVLTGIAFPGRFVCVLNELDLSRSEAECKAYLLRAVKNHSIGWAKDEVARRGIPLDEPLRDLGEGEEHTLHDILADPGSPIPDAVMASTEASDATRRTLEDLASRERQAMENHFARVADDLRLDAAERRRLHDGKEAFRIIHAHHVTAESAEGQECLAFLARLLLRNEQNRRLLVDHFCHGLSLSAIEPGGDPDLVRHRLLRAARVLWPFLEPCQMKVYSLMPEELRQRTEALLTSADPKQLAERLACSEADLEFKVRLLQADVALLLDAVEKQSSPKGRCALARRICGSLSGVKRSIALDVWVLRQSLGKAAAAAGLPESKAREVLFEGLRRMAGRKDCGAS